ncbi:MAG: virulence protein RhuM/Fic/DOC family protein [Leptotrichia sp.]|nr:virulence protein RhuM/Fic/DOC family protein [Leptotrichia sp.]
MNNEVILYKDGELELPVEVAPDKETVWLKVEEMAKLFDRDRSVIQRHIRNIFKENELEESSTCAKFAQVQNEGDRSIERTFNYYNLDMIISVGYRVKSPRGIAFRKWATSILKEYIVQGYAVNAKRLNVLNKVVEIQSNIIADVLELDSREVFDVIQKYTQALELLDDYDHQIVQKPKISNEKAYQLTFNECKKLIESMTFSKSSTIFGKEKTKGSLEGIIGSVYQTAFGEDVYPSVQEKAANLLYFIVKDHPFIDGCKRIAASIFLYFLNKNNLLFKNNKKIISDSTLVAITLLLAESRPEEKEIMINVIMNFLEW